MASPSTALAALVLALLGLVDLTACSLPEEIGSLYWGSQAPIRCTFFFVLTGYTYAFKPEGPIWGASEKASPWNDLHNSVVFTWAFLEMISWFWVSPSASSTSRIASVLKRHLDFRHSTRGEERFG